MRTNSCALEQEEGARSDGPQEVRDQFNFIDHVVI
jgi:hypothetical protein